MDSNSNAQMAAVTAGPPPGAGPAAALKPVPPSAPLAPPMGDEDAAAPGASGKLSRGEKIVLGLGICALASVFFAGGFLSGAAVVLTRIDEGPGPQAALDSNEGAPSNLGLMRDANASVREPGADGDSAATEGEQESRGGTKGKKVTRALKKPVTKALQGVLPPALRKSAGVAVGAAASGKVSESTATKLLPAKYKKPLKGLKKIRRLTKSDNAGAAAGTAGEDADAFGAVDETPLGPAIPAETADELPSTPLSASLLIPPAAPPAPISAFPSAGAADGAVPAPTEGGKLMVSLPTRHSQLTAPMPPPPPPAPSSEKFALQAGTYLQRSNANAMVAVLADRGYDARIQDSIDVNDVHWYRVRFGSFDSLPGARSAAEAFRNLEGLSAFVVKDASPPKEIPPESASDAQPDPEVMAKTEPAPTQ